MSKPPSPPPPSQLKMLSFRADEETLEALKKLEGAVGAGSMRSRSTVLRNLILTAAKKLSY